MMLGQLSKQSFYDPTPEHIAKLQSTNWVASFSGGKDSTSLVTWVEWLRRAGHITVPKPRLVQSDTTVEYPEMQTISRGMMDVLRRSGWECVVVEPLIHEKLYNRILGIGNSPIHPGIRRMRWCTRSTKIAPMERSRDLTGDAIALTGLRLGESTMRDGKIKKHAGCAAGGECGMPEMSERTYSPILHWRVCQVLDWLRGYVRDDVQRLMDDLYPVMQDLIDIYDFRVDGDVFEFSDPIVTAARFGCIGCPAIQAGRLAPASSIKRHGKESPLNELYDVWFEARLPENRIVNLRKTRSKDRSKDPKPGPIRMEVRESGFLPES